MAVTIERQPIDGFKSLGTLTGLFLVLIIVVGWQSFQCIHQIFRADLRKIPGPRWARITAFWRPWVLRHGQAPEVYYELHQKYGPLVRTAPAVVSISDPGAISTIYGIGTKYYKSMFYSIFDVAYKGSWMPSMFSVRDPARHQALRRPVAAKFSMSSMKAMEPFADECTDIFLQAMQDLEGQKVDLSTWLQWYAFDVISAMTFHRRFGFMEQRKDVEHMIGDISNGLVLGAAFSQVPSLHPWFMGSRWLHALLSRQPFFRAADPLRTIVKFTEECMDEYDRNPPTGDRPDFMAWIRQSSVKGEPMSDADLVNHLSNNLLAGSDTTAISLRAVFYYLVKNPKCYKKTQAEIDDADRNGKLSQYVTYAECLQLPYLQAVMKEAMRCHPGVSYPLERVVPAGGAEFCGVRIKEGTIVGINPAVIHRDTAIFGQDAMQFRPERWLGPDEERIKYMDRHLMTFGYGARTCIGKNISIMEMGKFVPQVLRMFDIEWASDDSEWHVYTYWFARQEGLICKFKRREMRL